jgi:heme oxygenase
MIDSIKAQSKFKELGLDLNQEDLNILLNGQEDDEPFKPRKKPATLTNSGLKRASQQYKQQQQVVATTAAKTENQKSKYLSEISQLQNKLYEQTDRNREMEVKIDALTKAYVSHY